MALSHFEETEEFKQNAEVYNTFESSKYSKEENILYVLSLLEKHIHDPPSLIEMLKDIAALPDSALMYLVVEIKLMNEEDGWLAFEKREDGCIKAAFEAIAKMLESTKHPTVNHEQFKEAHAITTNPKHVKIEGVDKSNSGKYRSFQGKEYVNLEAYQFSPQGLQFLAQLILSEELGSLNFIKLSDFEQHVARQKQRDKADMFSAIFASINMLNHSQNLTAFKNWVRSNLRNQNNPNDLVTLISDENCDYFMDFFDPSQDEAIIELIDKDLREANTEEEVFSVLKKLALYPQFQEATQNLQDVYDQTFERINKEIKSFLKIQTQMQKVLILEILSDLHNAENFINELKQQDENILIKCPEYYEIIPLMEKMFEQYNLHPEKNNEERFENLFNFIQLVLLIHPFIDANNRVFVNEFGNCKLLHDFALIAAYFNPFIFYAHQPKEMLEGVKLACGNFLALIDCYKNNNPRGFILKNDVVTDTERSTLGEDAIADLRKERMEKMDEMVKPFRTSLNKMIALVTIENIIKDYLTFTQKSGSLGMFKSDASEKIELDSLLLSLKKCPTVDVMVSVLKEKSNQLNSTNKALMGLIEQMIDSIQPPETKLEKKMS